jgi:hypothetical protein
VTIWIGRGAEAKYASGEDHREPRNGRRDQAARAGRFCGHQFHGRRSAIRLAG